MTERGEHFVQSLERGLAVIRAFGPEDPELTLSDVARRTGLTRAAARRFLLTLDRPRLRPQRRQAVRAHAARCSSSATRTCRA